MLTFADKRQREAERAEDVIYMREGHKERVPDPCGDCICTMVYADD